MSTFKVPPGCKMPLTPEGVRIDFIFNNKDITQTFSILTIDGVRTLHTVVDPGCDDSDPLREPRHPESDQI